MALFLVTELKLLKGRIGGSFSFVALPASSLGPCTEFAPNTVMLIVA